MIFSLIKKDLQSELRQRYALNSLLMFVLVCLTVVSFAMANEKLSEQIISGLIWIVMFFSAIISQGRSFVSEEERGTILLLRLTLSPGNVFLSKLMINIIFAIITNSLIAILFFLLIGDNTVKLPIEFFTMIFIMSIGFASSMTIISAIISRSQVKGALYPVLIFPIILPQMLLGIDLIRRVLIGINMNNFILDLFILIGYIIALSMLSWVLFDFIWKED
ncbi:MAG: heme exporter protein CcmB [Chlorobiota bacterium]|jgi:heme exporter protein B|nr:heme exporter protein CcmB [Chlorobiota bacterium]QQS67714.1 MAG: heme exporter protein CcmB [Chlorobiota bacterium]